ncbi:hypothetical protein ZWY2020_055687 [Hordeum vulgare]|nr:hypothetical protein ZWY2020_055687 [Hordeum vulgare]
MSKHLDSVAHTHCLAGFLLEPPMDHLLSSCWVIQSDALKTQEGASAKVTAFSPMEATISKARSSPLTLESLKVRRAEIMTKATFYMIPTLLLVSKNSISTSLLIASVYHQVYMFHKEILLDYVHHDITREWALIYFKLLLPVMAKDTMLYFDLF